MPEVEKIEVIRTTLRVIGRGTKDSTKRIMVQFWSLGGDLLAEVDPCRNDNRRTDRAGELQREVGRLRHQASLINSPGKDQAAQDVAVVKALEHAADDLEKVIEDIKSGCWRLFDIDDPNQS